MGVPILHPSESRAMTHRTCRVCSALEDVGEQFLDGLCPVCSSAVDAEVKRRQTPAQRPSITIGGIVQVVAWLAGLALAVNGSAQLHALHSPMIDGGLLVLVGCVLLYFGGRR